MESICFAKRSLLEILIKPKPKRFGKSFSCKGFDVYLPSAGPQESGRRPRILAPRELRRPMTRLYGACEQAGGGGSDETTRKIQEPLARNDSDDSHLSLERFGISPGINLFARARSGWSH